MRKTGSVIAAVLLFPALLRAADPAVVPSGDPPADGAVSQATDCAPYGVFTRSLGREPGCMGVTGSTQLELDRDFFDQEIIARPTYLTDMPHISHQLYDPLPDATKNKFKLTSHVGVFAFKDSEIGKLSVQASGESVWRFNQDPVYSLTELYAVLGPLTVGRAISSYDFGSGYTFSSGYASGIYTDQITYRHDLSKSMTLSMSIENAELRRSQDSTWSQYAKTGWPDMVLRLDGDHSGGIYQVMGAVHRIESSADFAAPTELGFAIGAGADFELRGIDGAKLQLSATYSDGALSYTGADFFSSDFFVEEGRICKTRAFSIMASIKVPVHEKIDLAATASYYHTITSGPSLEWETHGSKLSGSVLYYPVKHLTLGADLTYFADRVDARRLGVSDGADDAGRYETTLFMRTDF